MIMSEFNNSQGLPEDLRSIDGLMYMDNPHEHAIQLPVFGDSETLHDDSLNYIVNNPSVVELKTEKNDASHLGFEATPSLVHLESLALPWRFDNQRNEEGVENYQATPRLVSLKPVRSRYNFQCVVDGDQCIKKTWAYSSLLSKLFIKMNSPINLNFYFNKPDGELYVRTMLVFSEISDTHIAVCKCNNHVGKNDSDDRKNYIVISDLPEATYVGKPEGVNFDDRLAVIVKLNDRICSDENDKVLAAVPFKFSCLSSCVSGINRRATKMVFTLENQQGDILDKTFLDLKICSGPKRDQAKEEAVHLLSSGKRKKNKTEEVTEAPEGKRLCKPICNTTIKQEVSTEEEQSLDMVELKIKLPRAIMEHMLTCGYNAIAAEARKNDSSELSECSKRVKIQMKSIRRD